jgi:membrane associated rhomboid family serine protease
MATCYRHPDRQTGVSCSNCGRPICPDCMTATPVGMRCPECSKQTTKVRNVRAAYDAQPVVTIGIIAICVLLWFGSSSSSGGGEIYSKGVLFGPAVADGDWWRLVTSGFLHQPDFGRGILHIGFNMYVLWFLGNLLEPSLGPFKFAGLYFASLLTGSFAVLLVNPDTPTLGASGAIFGLMGAAFVMQRARGIDPMQSGIGPIILMNLALGFVIPNVSVAGHVGGLIGGALIGLGMDQVARYRRDPVLPLAICVLVGALAVVGSLIIV